jgi:hypothetical protein
MKPPRRREEISTIFFKVIAPAARASSLARCNAAPLANLSHLAVSGLASLGCVL